MGLATLLFFLFMVPVTAMGQIEARLLTNGYYRVGQYAPLAIRTTSPDLVGQRITLRAAGAIDTSIPIEQTDREVILPWLPIERVNGPLTWISSSGATGELPVELRLLDPDQPLPAVEGWDPDANVFPGPAGSVIGDTAYLPTHGWSPGVPEVVRRQVIVLAMLFSAMALWISVWRPRGVLLWIVGASLLMLATVLWYRHSRPPVHLATGEIITVKDNVRCVDTWLYETARRQLTRRISIADRTHPFFATRESFHASQMTLHCRPDGTPEAFEYQLLPNRRMAFRSRRIEEAAPPDTLSPALSSPMLPLARQLYLRRGSELTGQLSAPPSTGALERWPGVLIRE